MARKNTGDLTLYVDSTVCAFLNCPKIANSSVKSAKIFSINLQYRRGYPVWYLSESENESQNTIQSEKP